MLFVLLILYKINTEKVRYRFVKRYFFILFTYNAHFLTMFLSDFKSVFKASSCRSVSLIQMMLLNCTVRGRGQDGRLVDRDPYMHFVSSVSPLDSTRARVFSCPVTRASCTSRYVEDSVMYRTSRTMMSSTRMLYFLQREGADLGSVSCWIVIGQKRRCWWAFSNSSRFIFMTFLLFP